MAPPRIAFVTQAYVPDPASVGQHLAEVAAELARRGSEVTVFTSSTGYSDPTRRYQARETIEGVTVVRLPLSSFGKGSLLARVAGGSLFLLQCAIRLLAMRRNDAIVVTTVPPHAIVAGALAARLRRSALKFWIMDLNPDQAVAMGVVPPGALSVRVFERLLSRGLAAAGDVIVLDDYMAKRVAAKARLAGRLHVLPPWALNQERADPSAGVNPFTRAHGLEGRRVLMYSGNHSPANPLTTILQAARQFAGDDRVAFLFVGEGAAKHEVHELTQVNVRSLPYQPLSELPHSLAAADVHIVTMGDAMVGVIHPSKVYGAMAAARPILYCGPRRSHIGDLVAAHDIGWQVSHGDVAGAERIIREIIGADAAALREKGRRARALLEQRFDPVRLRAAVADILSS